MIQTVFYWLSVIALYVRVTHCSEIAGILNDPTLVPMETSCVAACYNGGRCHTTITSGTNDTTIYSTSGCQCSDFFMGSSCEILDMNVPDVVVGTHYITFYWPSPMLLANYKLMYMRNKKGHFWFWTRRREPDVVDITIRAMPPNASRIFNIIDLKGDATQYTLCFLHGEFLPNMSNPDDVRERMAATRPDCGIVVTSYGGGKYTQVAQCVLSIMVATLAVLMVVKGVMSCRDTAKREELKLAVKKSFHFLRRGSRF